MGYEPKFKKNCRESGLSQYLPKWWSDDDIIKAIGQEISKIKAEWIFYLLNSGIKPPVLLWKNDINYENFTITGHITNDSNQIKYKAPLYETKGNIKVTNTSLETISHLKIMIDPTNGIIIEDDIKSNDILLINLETQKYYINEKEISPTIIEKGIPYFIQSQRQAKYTNPEYDLHNAMLKITFTSESNIDADVEVNFKNVVFNTEQNIEITSIEVLPIKKVELYAYYDFKFNQKYSGWAKVYEKEYIENTNVLADHMTTHFFTQKFYVEVTFKGLDYPYRVGFPCDKNEDEDSMYHVNNKLDMWGELLGLPRRYYKESILNDDYPYTFPPYYWYNIEQDFWYYSRLINEYCWNEHAKDYIYLKDTNEKNIMRLDLIDPFVQDFVVHSKTIEPSKTENINFNKYYPKTISQQSSVANENKQENFINIQSLLLEQKGETDYSYITLYKNSDHYISREQYRSKLIDFNFDCSNLPENINITGIEITIEGDSTDNSVDKIIDERSKICIFNDNTEIFSNNKLDINETFGTSLTTIKIGGENDNFELQSYYTINGIKTDIRDILIKNGLDFYFGLSNESNVNLSTSFIYNVYLKIYYKPKKELFKLQTNLKKIQKDNKIGELSVFIENIGQKPLTTNIDIFNENGISLEKNNIFVELDIGEKREDIISIYPEYPIIDKKYQILTVCENIQKYNEIIISQKGQIETEVSFNPQYISYNNDLNFIVNILTLNKMNISEGNIKLYLNDYFIKQFSIENGKSEIKISFNDIKKFVDTGINKMEIRYSGSKLYQPSRKLSTLLISKHKIRLDILSNKKAYYNYSYLCEASVCIERNINDSDSYVSQDNINEGIITFYIDDKEIGSMNVTNGRVFFDYQIVESIGAHTLTAIYNGSLNYSYKSSEIELNIYGGDTICSLFDAYGSPGENITLITKVNDLNNKPVTQGSVDFYINDILIQNCNLNEEGIASINYLINNNIIPINEDNEIELPIRVEYKDSEKIYNDSNNEKLLIIKRKDIKILFNTIIASQYEPIGFLFKLQSIDSNQPITEGKIQLMKDNIVFAEGDVDKDGYCRIIYNPINYLQSELNKLNNFNFYIDNNNLYYIYDDSTELINNDKLKIVDDIDIDFFIENKDLYIEALINPENNIYREKDSLYTITNLNNTISLFNEGIYYYDLVYSSQNYYKQKIILNNKIIIKESNIDLDLLDYNIYFNSKPNIICYVTKYDWDTNSNDNLIEDFGDINLYIDGKLINSKISSDYSDKSYVTIPIEDINNYTAEKHLLQAEYIPNNINDTKTITSSYLNINKIDTIISTKIPKTFINEQTYIDVEIQTLTENQTNVYSDGIVQLYLNDLLIDTKYLSLNDFGKCTFFLKIPSDANEIIDEYYKYQYTIKYLGNSYTNPSEYQNYIIPKKEEIELQIDDYKTCINNDCKIIVNLISENNDNIPDGDVSLYYNNIEIDKTNIVDNQATFIINIDNSYKIGNYEFYVMFNNSTNYIDKNIINKFNIEIINPINEIWVSKNGKDTNKGNSDSPMRTLSQALQCIKQNGTIYLVDDIYITEDIFINKDINIQGLNGSSLIPYLKIKEQLLNINIFSDVIFDNILINTQYSKLNINNKYSFEIYHSIIGKEVYIYNQGKLIANRNLFYGQIYNLNNANIDNNWWGSNKGKYKNKNNILLKIKSENNPPVIGEDISLIVYFEGENQEQYDLPSPNIIFSSETGYFSISNGYFINNEIKTIYYDGEKEENINVYVDDETLSFKIYDYSRKTKTIFEEIDVPIDNQIPLKAFVQSAAKSYYEFNNNEIMNNDKIINNGKINFYYQNNNDEFIKLGNSIVKNGIAELDIFFTSKKYNIGDKIKIKAEYIPDGDDYFSSSTIGYISIIDQSNIIFVSNTEGKNTNNGSYHFPVQSIQEAVNRMPNVIYLKEGEYNEAGIILNNDITIKNFNGNVIFNNLNTSLPIFNILTQATFEGITFKNIKHNAIFNNTGYLTVRQCVFDTNYLISDTTDETNIIDIQYSVILSTNPNLFNIKNNKIKLILEYNWWGKNDVSILKENYNFENWIIMSIDSSKKPIILNSVVKLDSLLIKYKNQFGEHLLNNNIPLRIAKFFSNFGSLKPIFDYTYNNKTTTLFNSLEKTNTKQIILKIYDTLNYLNQEEIQVKCKIENVYGELITEKIPISFNININEKNIKKTIEANDGIAIFKIENNFNNIGIYPITCSCIYNENTFIEWDSLIIEKPEIIVKNISFSNDDKLYKTGFSCNFIDSIGKNIQKQYVELFIDNIPIYNNSRKELTNKYYIENGYIDLFLQYLPIKSGKHTLTLKINSEEYQIFSKNIDFISTEKSTYIDFKYTALEYNSDAKLKINILDNDSNPLIDIPNTTQLISYLKIGDFELKNIELNQGTCIINIPKDFLKEKGTYDVIIIYDGLLEYYSNSSYYGTIDVGVQKVFIDTEKLQKTLSIKIDQKLDLNFDIWDINNNKVQSGYVEFYINGILLKQLINNEYQPTIAYVSDGKIESLNNTFTGIYYGGEYSFEIKYYDTENKYANTSFKTIINIEQYNPEIYIDTIIGEPNSTISVPYEIYYEKGILSKGQLNAYLNNELIGEINLKQNNKIINLNIPMISKENTYNIIFEYYDDSCQINSKTIEVLMYINNKKVNIYPISDNTKYYPNTEFYYYLNIKDSDNKDIETGSVQIFKDSIFVEEVPVNNGQIFTKINLKHLKTYTFDFLYIENNYYKESKYTTKIQTNELPIDNIVIKQAYDSDYNIIDKLIGEPNQKINAELDIQSKYQIYDGTILLFIDNQKLGQFNINKENTFINFVIPYYNAGEYLLNIQYINSELFENKSVTIPITIEKEHIELLLDCPSEIKVNDIINITANINSLNNVNGIIKFYIANRDDLIYQYIGIKEVKENKCTLAYHLPKDTPEHLIIKAVFIETDKTLETEKISICDIIKINPDIDLDNYNVEYNENVNFVIKSNNVESEIISLYINNIQIGSEVINNGELIINYDIIEEPGEYILAAKFDGNSVFNEKIIEKKLIVNKAIPYLTKTSSEENICSIIQLPNYFVNKQGNEIKDGIISYYYNNKEISENYYFDSTNTQDIKITYSPIDNINYQSNEEIYTINPLKNNIKGELIGYNSNTYYERGEETNTFNLLLESNSKCPINSNIKIYCDNEEVDIIGDIKNDFSFIIPNNLYKETYKLLIMIEENDKFNELKLEYNLKISNKNIIYVDNDNGLDTNSGSIESPVKTIKKAFNMVADIGEINLLNGVFEDENINSNKLINIIGNDCIIKSSSFNFQNEINITNINMEESIINSSNILKIINSSFKNNSQIISNKKLTIDTSYFENNNNSAIIIENQNKMTLIQNSYFINNNGIYGGAIYAKNGNEVNIFENYFINNSSSLGGNSIYSIGRIQILYNNFVNTNSSEYEIKIVNGIGNIEANLFNSNTKNIQSINSLIYANFNYWGTNDNIQNGINSSDSEIQINSWIKSDYRIDKVDNNTIKIYPLLNKYDIENEAYEVNISEDKLNMEAIFDVVNADIDNNTILTNKEYCTIKNITNNTKIYLTIGQETFEVIL